MSGERTDKGLRLDVRALEKFTTEIFRQAGLRSEDAALQAEVLVWANLHGVDSHGVLRVPWYVQLIDTGKMNPAPAIRVIRETPALALIDADHAPGPVVTTQAMALVIKKARAVGIGWAIIKNTTHQGALAYYSLLAARARLIGLALVCSPPNMAPHGARAAGVHNSPITIAVPADRHGSLVLDMATSVAAGGKLRLAVDKRESIPLGWALDAEGRPTTDPNLASILLPLGGPKGSGLAMLFECLSSLAADNPLFDPPESAATNALFRVRDFRQNGVVAAIDVSALTDIERYTQAVDCYIDGLKRLPKADGVEEIHVPGELEKKIAEERKIQGIPLPGGTIQNLRGLAERFGVAWPPAI